jgi:ATP-binding cassette subfamily C (CFTR/MRP) protein 1
MDEATASVDYETDVYIQEAIKEGFKNSTVLTIAHRINTIMNYDRAIVLKQGKVIEYDSPQALLNDRDSTFYSLAYEAGLIL